MGAAGEERLRRAGPAAGRRSTRPAGPVPGRAAGPAAGAHLLRAGRRRRPRPGRGVGGGRARGARRARPARPRPGPRARRGGAAAGPGQAGRRAGRGPAGRRRGRLRRQRRTTRTTTSAGRPRRWPPTRGRDRAAVGRHPGQVAGGGRPGAAASASLDLFLAALGADGPRRVRRHAAEGDRRRAGAAFLPVLDALEPAHGVAARPRAADRDAAGGARRGRRGDGRARWCTRPARG